MGEVLVVTTMSEESETRTLWIDGPDHRPVQLRTLYGGTPDGRGTSLKWHEILARHPDAYYRVRVERDHLWHLPREPLPVRDWTPEEEQAPAEVVREHLQAFLNAQLRHLEGTMRSGWWRLGKVEVQVVRCDPLVVAGNPTVADHGAEASDADHAGD